MGGGGGVAHNKREKALRNLVKQSAYAFCNNQNCYQFSIKEPECKVAKLEHTKLELGHKAEDQKQSKLIQTLHEYTNNKSI